LKLNYEKSLLDEKVYRSADGWAASDLRLLAKSYGHYKHKIDFPEDYSYTAALRAGTIVHACVLEPERFDEEFVVPPEINKRTKAGKEEWAEWESENGDKFALTAEEYDKAMVIRHHVMRNERAAELFTGGMAEVPVVWEEEINGKTYKMKGRADYVKVIGDQLLVLDLKTTQEATYDAFQRSVMKWDYCTQAQHYRRGFEVLHPGMDVSFIWIPVEKQPPYGCQIFQATPEIYEYGQALREQGFKNLELGESNPELAHLPYSDEIQRMKLPQWFKRQQAAR